MKTRFICILIGIVFFSKLSYGVDDRIKCYWQEDMISDEVLWVNEKFYIPVSVVEQMGYNVELLTDGITINRKIYEMDNFKEVEEGKLYRGSLENGKPMGYGECINRNYSVYSGNFISGYPSGEGELVLVDGTVYTGSFELGVFNGDGQIHYGNGDTYEGEFFFGMKQGLGKQTYSNETLYYGQWMSGLWDGYGKYIDKDGRVNYAFWENGRMKSRTSKEEFNLFIDTLKN